MFNGCTGTPVKKTAVVVILSRDPYPISSGRDLILMQRLNELRNAFAISCIYVLGEPRQLSSAQPNVKYVHSQWRITSAIHWSARSGFQSLQSWVMGGYVDKRCEFDKAPVAFIDGARALPFAPKVEYTVVDLDDLLSERYMSMMRNSGENTKVLGNFNVPVALKRLAQLKIIARLAVRYEAWAMARFERRVPQWATLVLLSSAKDAALLRQRTGRANILGAEPRTPPNAVNVSQPRDKVVGFLGDLEVGGNYYSLMDFLKTVWPVVLRAIPDATLEIVGKCEEPTRKSLKSAAPGIIVRGYVEDLDEGLRRWRCGIASNTLAGGIKTKVLQYMVRGVVPVCSPASAEGYSSDALLTATSPSGYAGHIVHLLEDDGFWLERSRRSVEYAQARKSDDWTAWLTSRVAK